MIGHDLHVFWYLAVMLHAELQLCALLIALVAFLLALCGGIVRCSSSPFGSENPKRPGDANPASDSDFCAAPQPKVVAR
jgi:hypothetical protein